MGGAHTTSFVTVKSDGLDRYSPENLQHKYNKLPGWMFHGVVFKGRKGPAVFWEKDWGTMNSAKYNNHILPDIQQLIREYPELIFRRDNAPCHKSAKTRANLCLRGISFIRWPPYSPDLNIIEHVWNWMKNWIQNYYFHIMYNPQNIQFPLLRQIILEAWEAVPEAYIVNLFKSWWKRCQAIIDPNGGPTKY